MWFNEEDCASHFKTEFMMIQSCERNKDKMIYKNINRKFIPFDLNDLHQMVEVARLLKPFGFIQYLQNKFVDSKRQFLRLWAERALAKRGKLHLCRLYQENPEKFFDISFDMDRFSKCKYILSETKSQKVISLQNETMLNDEMEEIRKCLSEKQNALVEEQNLARDFSPEKTSVLIG